MISKEYPYGFERDLFENMSVEELYALASIGYYHIRELEKDLQLTEQTRISMGIGKNTTKEDVKEADRLRVLYSERKAAERGKKEACMYLYARIKDASMIRLMNKYRKEDKENKKDDKND